MAIERPRCIPRAQGRAFVPNRPFSHANAWPATRCHAGGQKKCERKLEKIQNRHVACLVEIAKVVKEYERGLKQKLVFQIKRLARQLGIEFFYIKLDFKKGEFRLTIRNQGRTSRYGGTPYRFKKLVKKRKRALERRASRT